MNEDVEFIIERSGDGKKPGYFISGVFMQAEQKNRNGRIYPMEVLQPMGKIVQSLMDEGAKLGVSTRGMGSLKEVNGVNRVQSDFSLAAVDIVADPSAPDAFVDGIMEGKEWIWENGLLKEKHIQEYKKQITNVSSRNMKKKFTNLFEDFLRKI